MKPTSQAPVPKPRNHQSGIRRTASFDNPKSAAPSSDLGELTRDAGAQPGRRQATQAWVDSTVESRITTASTGGNYFILRYISSKS